MTKETIIKFTTLPIELEAKPMILGEETEIKVEVDTSTLPIDGRRVTWLTVKNANAETNNVWKKGEYVASESLFMECKLGEDSGDFDYVLYVERWKYLEDGE